MFIKNAKIRKFKNKNIDKMNFNFFYIENFTTTQF